MRWVSPTECARRARRSSRAVQFRQRSTRRQFILRGIYSNRTHARGFACNGDVNANYRLMQSMRVGTCPAEDASVIRRVVRGCPTRVIEDYLKVSDGAIVSIDIQPR